MSKKYGSLTVIAGPMYSGKTEELIRLITRALIAKKHIQVFNHDIDIRYGKDKLLYAHTGRTVHARRVASAKDILSKIRKNTDIVAIDEAQWFGDELPGVVDTLVSMGKTVYVAGLALTYERKPFPPIPGLMAMARHVVKLTAICTLCGADAMYHRRLSETAVDPLTPHPALVGHTVYQARCGNCFDK